MAQILKSHEAFSSVPENEHTIAQIAERANKQIEKYFEGIDENGNAIQDLSGKKLLSEINEYLKDFFTVKEINKIAKFAISDQSLSNILEKLILDLIEGNSGLGSYNRLYIAAELLLLKRTNYYGLKLSLIEEIEAHLHPQAQLRLIEFLQNEIANKSGVQLIITTHSPNIASKVKLDNLIICKSDQVFPMGSNFTELEKGDYLFLERFLDATKANLFFSQGIIMVEGDAENILVPVIAELLDKPLTKHGVSVVNVQGKAFLRYSKIFKRKEGQEMDVKIAIITDNDIEPHRVNYVTQFYNHSKPRNINPEEIKKIKSILTLREITRKRTEKENQYNGQRVKTFISPDWTLEYDIAMSGFKKEFYNAVLRGEKIQNSDSYGLTNKKIEEVNLKVNNDFISWTKENYTEHKIAKTIYKDYMLKKGISKSIVAQCFVTIIQECSVIKERIENDKKLKYLVNAINYETE